MIDTWIVVADGSRASFYTTDSEMAELSADGGLTNRHHAGAHRSHSAEGHDSAHHTEESRFAAEIAGEIARRVSAHEVRDVVLVAPVRFLGDLTAALPKTAASHVTATLGRDLTKVERHALSKRLRAAFAEHHETH